MIPTSKRQFVQQQRNVTYKKIRKSYTNVSNFRVIDRSHPLQSRKNKFLKRSFDVVFSGLVIVGVLSWLLPILGILIMLDSRGGMFYVQGRGGYKGKYFSCLKLRTMRTDSGAFRQATRNDSRVTRVGKYLRQYNLDELPQFFNVFVGHMSVVGPRPHAIAHDEQFLGIAPNYALRWRVKPGITGLSQSKGLRGETIHGYQMKSRSTLDNFYIDNWNMKMDIQVVFWTMTRIDNAY